MDHTLDNGRNVVGQNEIAELACDGSEALLFDIFGPRHKAARFLMLHEDHHTGRCCSMPKAGRENGRLS